MKRGNPPEKSAPYRPKAQALGLSGLTYVSEYEKITNPVIQTTPDPQISVRICSSPTGS